MTGDHVVAILRSLETYYDAQAEDVRPFLQTDDTEGARERLLVRQDEEALELSLVLPTRVAESPWHHLSLDEQCQRVEGASHFLLLCHRARAERRTTQLELELQAEVDKWMVLSGEGELAPDHDEHLRQGLYSDPMYLHPPASFEGERYRLANTLASRFTRRLSRELRHHRARKLELRVRLRAFFELPQEEKLRVSAVE